MLPGHPGTRVTHDNFDLLSAIPPITMNLAVRASGFLSAETAMLQARFGILEQITAIRAKLTTTAMLTVAVTFNHGSHGFPFASDALEAGRRTFRRCFAETGRLGRDILRIRLHAPILSDSSRNFLTPVK
jgi:hypothetical protein